MDKVNNSELSQYDLDRIALYNVTNQNRILKHLIGSYNEFINVLPNIIQEQFNQSLSYDYRPAKDGISRIEYGMSFHEVKVGVPMTSKAGESCPMYPSEAKRVNKSYTAPIISNILLWRKYYNDPNNNGKLELINEIKEPIKNQLLGYIPVMVKSEKCNLNKKPNSVILELGEDPYDLGGYFIIKGSSKSMISRKNNVKNIPLFTKDKSDIIRCKFSSQMGDYYEQSKYIVMHLYPNGELLIDLSIKKDLTLTIPFYILYYILEMFSDKDIFSTIIPDFDPQRKDHIIISSMFTASMTIDYTQIKASISEYNKFSDFYNLPNIKSDFDLLMVVANTLNINDPSKVIGKKYRMENHEDKHNTYMQLKRLFNENVFPHLGIEDNDRKYKLNSLGQLIRHMYDVRNGTKPTDRNSLENVAVYNPAPGLVSMFKSVFNFAVVTNIMTSINKKIKKETNVNMTSIFNKTHKTNSLLDITNKSLSAGNKPEIVIKKDHKIKNRNTTITKDITNKGASVSVGMSITNDPNTMEGKSNDSVIKSKSVHPSEDGVKCILQSIEGEDTGNVGQMAISCEITGAIDSNPLINMLKPELEEFDKMVKKGSTYSRVFVNGRSLGTYHDTRLLARKYREYRRQGKIHYQTSISYKPLENGELHFYTNMSRLIRPMVIIYQNREDWEDKYNTWPSEPEDKKLIKKGVFQYHLYTKKHAELLYKNQITLKDLVKEGVIEFIAPNENMNIIVCDSLYTFEQRKDDRLYEFTHMGIPIGALSLSILCGTFPSCSQFVRCVYVSKFVKQSFAFATVSYHNSFNKKLPIRYKSYNTFVKSVTNDVYNYGATSVIVAIMADAYNQEDAITVSESFVQKNKFTVDIYSYISHDLDSREMLETPIPELTEKVKNVDYSHLKEGLPLPGTIIKKDMPIIGIVERDGDKKIDKSHFHKKNFDIIIVDAIKDFNDLSQIVKISYKVYTPIEQGDKFAAKSGCKGVVSIIKPDHSMPVTASGVIPDMLINAASFPSRMVNGQLIEGRLGEICAHLLTFADGTFFKKPDIELMDRLSDELGLNKEGSHIMFNGATGKRIKVRIGLLINGYHRLYKIIKENSSIISIPIINKINMQPEKGINKGGGQKLGYMEIDTYNAHGCSNLMEDVLINDSDVKTIYACDRCGAIAAVNEKEDHYLCANCQGLSTFSKYKTSHATSQIIHYMTVFGVKSEIRGEMAII